MNCMWRLWEVLLCSLLVCSSVPVCGNSTKVWSGTYDTGRGHVGGRRAGFLSSWDQRTEDSRDNPRCESVYDCWWHTVSGHAWWIIVEKTTPYIDVHRLFCCCREQNMDEEKPLSQSSSSRDSSDVEMKELGSGEWGYFLHRKSRLQIVKISLLLLTGEEGEGTRCRFYSITILASIFFSLH